MVKKKIAQQFAKDCENENVVLVILSFADMDSNHVELS